MFDGSNMDVASKKRSWGSKYTVGLSLGLFS